MIKNKESDLSYFVEWRPLLWEPAVKWLIGDKQRFKGARILEIGCAHGRMSCYFGLLGATVVGIDVTESPKIFELARNEAQMWGLSERVTFQNYDGDPLNIPGQDYDFVFTKSVFVMIPNLETFLPVLLKKMKPGGELLSAENTDNSLAHFLRRRYRGRRFHGVNKYFLNPLETVFERVEVKNYFSLVTAIRATKSLDLH